MIRKNTFIILLSLLIFASCQNDVDDIVSADRTLIVYMAADNDLSADALKNLGQIEKAYLNTGAKLVVFIDTSDDLPRILEVTKAGSVVIQEYQEFNSVSAEKMNEVLQEIISLYPSEHYGLVLWSHGTSWLPAGSLLRAFGSDGNKQLNIPELAEALPSLFDFILFDACLMGAVEVAYELRHKVDYIIAPSTETIADGFPYELIIPELLSFEPDLKQVAQTYFNFYNNQNGAYRSATISLINASELETLAAETKKLLAGNNIDFLSFDRTSVQRLDVYDELYHFDMLDFFNKALPDADKSDFEEQLKRAVLYKDNTPQFIEMYDIDTYCGLSCYIPNYNRPDLNGYYSGLEWYIDSGMNILLN